MLVGYTKIYSKIKQMFDAMLQVLPQIFLMRWLWDVGPTCHRGVDCRWAVGVADYPTEA